MTDEKKSGDTIIMNRDELMYSLYSKQSGQLPHAFLEVAKGADSGKRFMVGDAKMLVGRSNSCHIQLTDPSVSGKHVEIRRGEIGLIVEDLGSSNGLIVNDQKVQRAVLANNDLIRIGQTVLQVKL